MFVDVVLFFNFSAMFIKPDANINLNYLRLQDNSKGSDGKHSFEIG